MNPDKPNAPETQAALDALEHARVALNDAENAYYSALDEYRAIAARDAADTAHTSKQP